jgi:hypothetical protein
MLTSEEGLKRDAVTSPHVQRGDSAPLLVRRSDTEIDQGGWLTDTGTDTNAEARCVSVFEGSLRFEACARAWGN